MFPINFNLKWLWSIIILIELMVAMAIAEYSINQSIFYQLLSKSFIFWNPIDIYSDSTDSTGNRQ